jgi:hypothetical protein
VASCSPVAHALGHPTIFSRRLPGYALLETDDQVQAQRPEQQKDSALRYDHGFSHSDTALNSKR